MDSSPEIDEGFTQFFESKLSIIIGGYEEEIESNSVTISIYISQVEDDLDTVRFRLSDDNNLQFLYESDYNNETFSQMKEQQSLEIDFEDFPNVIRQVLEDIINEQSTGGENYGVVFNLEGDETQATLNITQKLDFCDTDIFIFDFFKCETDKILSVTQQRYDIIAEKAKKAETEYKDLLKRIQRQDANAIIGHKGPTTF